MMSIRAETKKRNVARALVRAVYAASFDAGLDRSLWSRLRIGVDDSQLLQIRDHRERLNRREWCNSAL
jgi:hypothetical protein